LFSYSCKKKQIKQTQELTRATDVLDSDSSSGGVASGHFLANPAKSSCSQNFGGFGQI